MLSITPNDGPSQRKDSESTPRIMVPTGLPDVERKDAGSAIRSGPVIQLVEGDLLAQKVDAIVNAWNRNLIPHWLLVTQGVSGAIKRFGGTEPFNELRDFGILPLGAARLTGAGSLPFRGIIHVAGINHAWRSTETSVRKSVASALEIAMNEGFKSVAFPAIGAGSSLRFGSLEIPVWGISQRRSLEIIVEQAGRSNYQGAVVVVKLKKAL